MFGCARYGRAMSAPPLFLLHALWSSSIEEANRKMWRIAERIRVAAKLLAENHPAFGDSLAEAASRFDVNRGSSPFSNRRRLARC